MAENTTPEPDPALAVACPWEGGCGAPAGTPCFTSMGDGTIHADRYKLAALRALERGTCALCGQLMVRGKDPVDAWHPIEADAERCPQLPDPAKDWNAYALARQAGAEPGRPGVEHFIPAEVMDHVASLNLNEVAYQVEDLDSLPKVAVEVAVICPECVNGKHINCDRQAYHPVTDQLTPCTCTHGGLG